MSKKLSLLKTVVFRLLSVVIVLITFFEVSYALTCLVDVEDYRFKSLVSGMNQDLAEEALSSLEAVLKCRVKITFSVS